MTKNTEKCLSENKLSPKSVITFACFVPLFCSHYVTYIRLLPIPPVIVSYVFKFSLYVSGLGCLPEMGPLKYLLSSSRNKTENNIGLQMERHKPIRGPDNIDLVRTSTNDHVSGSNGSQLQPFNTCVKTNDFHRINLSR